MIRFLTDEDFNNDILRGLLRHLPKLNIIRVQDIEMRNVDDSIILPWAAQDNYVVLTHDVNTMVAVAFQRTQEDLPMPGVLAVQRLAPLAKAVVNVCYTFGRIGELAWRVVSGSRTRMVGQFLMRVGIGFTFFVISFPTVVWGVTWFWHIVILRH